ncbi:DNA polymerase III subunit gamma/tau [bacterium]|nr:DNA polymerase III subunit gamma/tau [bacterium]
MENKYIPLYRKYRPQTFLDLVGQENVVNTLSNAIKLNKIAHAYLLCGPRGTGKTSSARILAKSLNCQEGPTLTPCGKCPSCVDITNSVPVDVIEIDAASNRSVEDAHEILSKIQYVPVNGRYKIYIIDEVHMLSRFAFNALLKTLEEPPENVIFIFATTEPQKVLDTIISRCQRFDFKRITTDDIVKRLEYISEKENINISKQALYSIAKNSQGGMRDSLALLDQVSVLGYNKQIDVEDINELLGRISFDALYEIVEDISSANSMESVSLIDKIYSKGNEPIQILTNLVQYFRDLIILKNCQDKDLILNLTQLSEGNVDRAKAQADKFETDEIIQIIDRLSYYANQSRESTNKFLWLELCLIDLTNYKNLPSAKNLLKRIEALESQISTGNIAPRQAQTVVQAPKPVQSAPQPSAQPVVQSQPKPAEPQVEIKAEEKPEPVVQSSPKSSDLNSLWTSIVQNIKSPPAKAFYRLAKPVSIEDNEIVISFAKEIFIKQAKEDSKKLPLKQSAEEYLAKKDINIKVVLNGAPAQAEVTHPKLQPTPPAPVQAETKKEVKEEEEAEPEKVEENEDASYYEEQLKQAQPKEPDVDTSDQVKMIKELFSGKVI